MWVKIKAKDQEERESTLEDAALVSYIAPEHVMPAPERSLVTKFFF